MEHPKYNLPDGIYVSQNEKKLLMNYPAAELRGITKCHQTLLTDLGELDCIGFPAL